MGMSNHTTDIAAVLNRLADDLTAGRVAPDDERDLADMLAAYFESRTRPADPHADPEMFASVLATVERVCPGRA